MQGARVIIFFVHQYTNEVLIEIVNLIIYKSLFLKTVNKQRITKQFFVLQNFSFNSVEIEVGFFHIFIEINIRGFQGFIEVRIVEIDQIKVLVLFKGFRYYQILKFGLIIFLFNKLFAF